MNSNELNSVREEVKRILQNVPATRDNDMILYYEYCIAHWVRNFEIYRVFEDSDFRKSKGISPFESVSRARRDIQKQFIELRSSEKIQKMREEQENLYQQYFGKGELEC